MHAVPRPWPRRPRRRACRFTLRRRGRARCCAAPTARWPGSRPADGERLAGRRRRVHPRPAGRLRAAAARRSPRPRAVRSGDFSPSAVVWHVGVRGTPAAHAAPPQHPLRRRLGRRLRGAHRPRRADARPVAAGHRAVASTDPAAAPPGSTTHVRARAGAAPRGRPRLAPRGAARCASACTPSSRPAATPPTSGEELLVRPTTGSAQGMHLGHPVRPGPHLPPVRARSGPATSTAGCRAWSSPARAPSPGSASRWCWSAASSPRSGCAGPPGRYRVRWSGERTTPVTARGAASGYAGAPDHPRARHDLLLGRPPAARREPPARHAVYALCRLADDIVDARRPRPAPGQTALALDAFERSFWVALAAGQPPTR